MTWFWSRDCRRLLVAAQNSLLSSVEASRSRSGQHTGTSVPGASVRPSYIPIVAPAAESPSKSCFSLCLAASCRIMVSSRAEFALASEGLGLRLPGTAHGSVYPPLTPSPARLSPVRCCPRPKRAAVGLGIGRSGIDSGSEGVVDRDLCRVEKLRPYGGIPSNPAAGSSSETGCRRQRGP